MYCGLFGPVRLPPVLSALTLQYTQRDFCNSLIQIRNEQNKMRDLWSSRWRWWWWRRRLRRRLKSSGVRYRIAWWAFPTSKKETLPGQFERAEGSLKPFKISPTTWRRTTGLDLLYITVHIYTGDRGGTVVKVLCYKSEVRWFDPS